MAQGLGSRLIYSAASGLEKAMADADAERLIAIYAEAIIDIWSPQDCPIKLLPYLAWAVGVEFWRDEWSEQTKRNWIAQQWDFKSKRGTRYAIETIVDFGGRDISAFGWKVKRIITQPQAFYASPGFTKEEYDAWLTSLPEIRLYRLHDLGAPNNIATSIQHGTTSPALATSPVVSLCTFAGPGTTNPDDLTTYVGIAAGDPLTTTNAARREAVLIENGVTTNLGIDAEASITSLEVETFYFPQKENFFFAGAFSDNNFAGDPSERPEYVASVKRHGDVAGWNLAHHSMQPVSTDPVVGVTRTRDSATVFAGGSPVGVFASNVQNNDRLIYESWRLAARGNIPERNAVVSYADISRVGWPPFTAEVQVDIRSRAADGECFAGYVAPTYYATKNDQSALDMLYQAINSSRSLRDKIWVDTAANVPPTFDTAMILDDLIF